MDVSDFGFDLPQLPGFDLKLPKIPFSVSWLNNTILQLPSIDLDKPKGKEWTEAAFGTIYPRLVRHYASGTEL